MASAVSGEWLRRLVHILTSLTIIYFWVPDELSGISKEYWLLLILVLILAVDFYRIYIGWEVYGGRPYEMNRPSALALGALALTICFIFFPKHLVIPSVLTMALVDPFIRLVRGNTHIYPYLPLFFAVVIFYTCFSLLTGWSFAYRLPMALLGGAIAIAVERPHLNWLDDDFLLLLVPTIVLYVIS